MIERNVREHDDPCAKDVRCVVPAAEPGFDDGDVDAGVGEGEERCGRHDFELRRVARLRPHLRDRRLEVGLLSTDANPLAPASDVRRQIRADAQTCVGEQRRIFEAVVRPERLKANGNVEAERERLRREVERSERMLANDRFTAKAPAEVVAAEREKLARYRRELDALSG